MWKAVHETYSSLFGVLALAPFLRDAAFFEKHQVFAKEAEPYAVIRPDERQRLFGMADIGVYGAAVYAEVACGFAHRIGLFRHNLAKQFAWFHVLVLFCHKDKWLTDTMQYVKHWRMRK